MYLHNRDLYAEIVVSKAQGRLTNKSKLMLEILAKRTIKKMRYWSNDDKLDCYWDNKKNCMVGIVDKKICYTPFENAIKHIDTLYPDMLRMIEILSA